MFGPDVDTAARTHALSCFPIESCGLVVDNIYVPIENIANDPVNHFEMPARAWMDHGKVDAVIHSHGPQASLSPSSDDMRQQIATAVPWGLIRTDGAVASQILWWGDFRLDESLIGREFVHGVTDCYSLIRSWYWQNRSVKLTEFPRDDKWWSAGEDLYNEGFGKAGFHEIPASQVSLGDVALINFRSKVPNHGGVLVEGELLLHHLQGRQSARVPLGNWRSLVSKWLRYEG